MSELPKHPDPAVFWKHRRRGYYAGKWGAFLQTPIWVIAEILSPGLIQASGPVIAWSYGLCGTLIIGYYGNTAVEELSKKGGRAS